MEKILLGVTGVRAEMRGGKMAQLLFVTRRRGKYNCRSARSTHTSTGNAESNP